MNSDEYTPAPVVDDAREQALRAVGAEPWPRSKKALWDVLMETRLNVGYVAERPLVERLYEAISADLAPAGNDYKDRIAKLADTVRHRNMDGNGERSLQQHVEELVALEAAPTGNVALVEGDHRAIMGALSKCACKKCGGSGEVNNAEAGDMYFRSWICDDCQGKGWDRLAYNEVMSGTPAAATTLHPDDLAVDRFATAMKAKLAVARAKGRHGWDDPENCTEEFLATLLVNHIPKGNAGNFEDIANLAMMLHQRGADPVVLAAVTTPTEDVLTVWEVMDALREFTWDDEDFLHEVEAVLKRRCDALAKHKGGAA